MKTGIKYWPVEISKLQSFHVVWSVLAVVFLTIIYTLVSGRQVFLRKTRFRANLLRIKVGMRAKQVRREMWEMFSFLSSATPFFPFLLSSQFFQQTRAKRPASLHHFDFWFIFSAVSLGHSQKKIGTFGNLHTWASAPGFLSRSEIACSFLFSVETNTVLEYRARFSVAITFQNLGSSPLKISSTEGINKWINRWLCY